MDMLALPFAVILWICTIGIGIVMAFVVIWVAGQAIRQIREVRREEKRRKE